jgi:Na+/serine symporter
MEISSNLYSVELALILSIFFSILPVTSSKMGLYSLNNCALYYVKKGVFSTYKTDRHDIAEILLKEALNTININLNLLRKNNYITSVFHWNVTIWLVMKWSHDYKRDVLHPNKTQTRTCTCLHEMSDVNNQWRSNFQQQII